MYFFYLFTLFKDYYRIFVGNGGNHLFNIVTIFSGIFPSHTIGVIDLIRIHIF